jgi:hypothetical protein
MLMNSELEDNVLRHQLKPTVRTKSHAWFALFWRLSAACPHLTTYSLSYRETYPGFQIGDVTSLAVFTRFGTRRSLPPFGL